MISKKNLIVLIGPTASGKTALAIKLAKHYGTEIISADSRQFFKELNIGTAKPSLIEQQGIPHHFIDSHSITDRYSVGDFEQEALNFCTHYFQKKNTLILTGGSGLYIDALCNGMDDLPKASDAVRTQLIDDYTKKGIEYLQQQLLVKDPVYYEQVDLNNPQRIIRALEVCFETGQPFSSFRQRRSTERPFISIKIGIDWPRDLLYKRINDRVDDMMQKGLLEEVRSLLAFRHLNALQTVGYKEIFEHLDGKYSLPETIELIKQNTRRYAKRQLTWFRRDPKTKWFHPEEFEGIIPYIDQELSRV